MSKTPALAMMFVVLGLAAPSIAAPAKTKALNCGESYVVGHKAAPTGLTAAQIDEVIKAKLGEVTACWHRLPAEQRKKDASAVLKLVIDDGGEVQTIDVAGIPDDAGRCIVKAAVAWTFPQTDVKVDAASYSYPVVLRAN
jgi:hypothetical protein